MTESDDEEYSQPPPPPRPRIEFEYDFMVPHASLAEKYTDTLAMIRKSMRKSELEDRYFPMFMNSDIPIERWAHLFSSNEIVNEYDFLQVIISHTNENIDKWNALYPQFTTASAPAPKTDDSPDAKRLRLAEDESDDVPPVLDVD